MSAALEYRGVVKCYGRRRALDGLEVSIPAGCVCGLVGANGAGKTTALAVAAGLARIETGEVRLWGEGPFDPARHSGRLALLPQDAELPRDARPLGLLMFYGELQGLSRARARAQAQDLLAQVHLEDRSASPIRALSHGMRKRLMIAQCFMGDPELVLLDEPLSGLDPKEALRARDLIVRLVGRRTVVISSHNLPEIERMCGYVVFMDRGKRLRSGSLEEVTRRAERLVWILSAAPPMETLRARAADVEFSWEEKTGRLEGRFAAGCAPDAVNARILPALLDAGVGIRAIERGARLEEEYLRQTG